MAQSHAVLFFLQIYIMFQAPSLFGYQSTWTQVAQWFTYVTTPPNYPALPLNHPGSIGVEYIITNCTFIARRYVINVFTNNERVYLDPLILQNPNCQDPPNSPPTPIQEPLYPDIYCQGDILILRVCIFVDQYRESFPVRSWNDYKHTLTGTILDVNFPIPDENGRNKATFTVEWKYRGWEMRPITLAFPENGIYEEQYENTVTITYEVDRIAGFRDYGTYVRRNPANWLNDSFQYEFSNREGAPGRFTPRFEITAYIGGFAQVFYDADFRNPSNVNTWTQETRPGTNFNSRDPQWLEFNFTSETQQSHSKFAYFTQCFSNPVNYNNIPPTPPEPPMACCPQNDQLLRVILRSIGRLPANVPNSLVAENPTIIRINSIAEYIAWQTIQHDALFGNFPIKIKVEDADATQGGNQAVDIELPNVAESMAEIIGLLILLKRESGINLETGIKALIEAGQAKQAATVSADIGLANAEYLGYEIKKVKRDIGFSFTPNKTKIDEFLKPKKDKYVTYDNTDKRSLKDAILPLLNMAARWNAQNFVRISTDVVRGARDIYELLNKGKKSEQQAKQAEDEAWSDWREEIEDGFTADPRYPPDDRDEPYGRNRDERPKIRKAGEPL